WGKGCCLPFSALVAGGRVGVGKNLPDAQVQPSRTSALSTTARIIFLLSFTGIRSSSRYRVVALAAPRMASPDPLQREPAAAKRPIAFDCGDRIGRAARLVTAARRQDLRRALLPAPGDQDHQPRD